MLVKQMMKHLVTSSDKAAWKRPSSKGSLQGREAEGDQQEPGRKTEEWARTNIGEATRMAERRDLWCTVIDVTAAQH